MAINLKAKETLIQVGELKGKYRYVLGTELYNKLSLRARLSKRLLCAAE